MSLNFLVFLFIFFFLQIICQPTKKNEENDSVEKWKLCATNRFICCWHTLTIFIHFFFFFLFFLFFLFASTLTQYRMNVNTRLRNLKIPLISSSLIIHLWYKQVKFFLILKLWTIVWNRRRRKKISTTTSITTFITTFITTKAITQPTNFTLLCWYFKPYFINKHIHKQVHQLLLILLLLLL